MSPPSLLFFLEVSCHDKLLVDKLINGFSSGFNIGVTELREKLECKNLHSAFKEKEFITAALNQEVENSFMAGPAASPPFKNYCGSPGIPWDYLRF